MSNTELSAYKALWAEVLNRALKDYASQLRLDRRVRKYKPANPDSLQYRGIVKWVHSDAVHPGSFVWVCHALELNQHRVRNSVEKQWRTLGANEKQL